MSRQQSTVIWLGLVIIALNLLLNASAIKSVIFSGSSGSSGSGSSNGSGGGGIHLPGVSLLPPGLLSTATPNSNQVV